MSGSFFFDRGATPSCYRIEVSQGEQSFRRWGFNREFTGEKTWAELIVRSRVEKHFLMCNSVIRHEQVEFWNIAVPQMTAFYVMSFVVSFSIILLWHWWGKNGFWARATACIFSRDSGGFFPCLKDVGIRWIGMSQCLSLRERENGTWLWSPVILN